MLATVPLPTDPSLCCCASRQTATFDRPSTRRRLFLLLGQSLPVLAHLLNAALFAGVSSGRGEAWPIKWLMSGSFKPSPASLSSPYLRHRSAAGSASGVFSSPCVALPAKYVDSCRCDEVVGHDGEELLARFRLRFGVSSVDELFGIQPSCSSGDFTSGSGLLACSSKLPIRSSNGIRAPGVHGKVLACGRPGVFAAPDCDDVVGSVECLGAEASFSVGTPPISTS